MRKYNSQLSAATNVRVTCELVMQQHRQKCLFLVWFVSPLLVSREQPLTKLAWVFIHCTYIFSCICPAGYKGLSCYIALLQYKCLPRKEFLCLQPITKTMLQIFPVKSRGRGEPGGPFTNISQKRCHKILL